MRIEKVGADSRAEVLRLEVADEHLPYVSTVSRMLQTAGDDEALECYAIRAAEPDENEVVGFFMLDFDAGRVSRYADPVGSCGLRGYLISTRHHGKGYGRAAIPEIRNYMRGTHPNLENLYLTVNLRNSVAIQTYLKAGFYDTGGLYHGGDSGPQHVFRLALR